MHDFRQSLWGEPWRVPVHQCFRRPGFILHQSEYLMATYSKSEKRRWLRKVYFGATDNPDDDVNPFTDIDVFYQKKVGDLDWGISGGAIKRSKKRFSENTRRLLQLFDVRLSNDVIFESVKSQKTLNTDVVEAMVSRRRGSLRNRMHLDWPTSIRFLTPSTNSQCIQHSISNVWRYSLRSSSP